MALRIYNTLRRAKEEFIPLAAPRVGMYVCGVTVYDLCHVGHARVYTAFDVIARYLRYRGYEVTYVRNFTDVDDKIIRRAAEQGEDPAALTERCIVAFHEDMAKIGVAPADVEPRVTQHMGQIVALVEELIARGHAYPSAPDASGACDVHFEIRSFDSYGALSGRDLEELKAGARVEVDHRKRDPLDFALWKAAKPGEPAWESPWGKGRPGWHIECSAMAMHYLGQTIDLHGGGKDLVFPHHENERAQSEGATGVPFVRCWMHNGFVNIDQEKMSKSLGNFFTIRDVIERYEPEALRHFLLTTHYRSPLNFNDAMLEEAERRVAYVYETLARLDGYLAEISPAAEGADLAELFGTAEQPFMPLRQFEAAMDDDFNTPKALSVLAEMLRIANALMDGKEQELIGRKLKPPMRARLLAEWLQINGALQDVLGLGLKPPVSFLRRLRERRCRRRDIEPEWVEEQVAARARAKAEKDFEIADRIRGQLAEKGVVLRDGREGTTWQI